MIGWNVLLNRVGREQIAILYVYMHESFFGRDHICQDQLKGITKEPYVKI